MLRVFRLALVAATLFLLGSGDALACKVWGQVVCDPQGLPIEGATVTLTGGNLTSPMVTTTNYEGFYYFYPACSSTYQVTLSVTEGMVVGAATRPVVFPESLVAEMDWTVAGVAACGQSALGCWLTGGGAKFLPLAGINVAEHGPKVSFGGNVNPSCSPEPGQGGQWTHVDHQLKLFFQGTQVVVDECGNVSGIPPGSTSPVTPYNYIEYSGYGRLRGIAGNAATFPEVVCFEARAEDRNEPGSSGNRDGARIDRYYLRVYDCAAPAGTFLMLGAPGAPITITDGNLQLHVSSCP
jgi:hypothetical protein